MNVWKRTVKGMARPADTSAGTWVSACLTDPWHSMALQIQTPRPPQRFGSYCPVLPKWLQLQNVDTMLDNPQQRIDTKFQAILQPRSDVEPNKTWSLVWKGGVLGSHLTQLGSWQWTSSRSWRCADAVQLLPSHLPTSTVCGWHEGSHSHAMHNVGQPSHFAWKSSCAEWCLLQCFVAVLFCSACCSACCRWSFPNFGKQFQGSRQIRKLLLLGPDVRVPRLVDKSSKQCTMKDSGAQAATLFWVYRETPFTGFTALQSEIFPMEFPIASLACWAAEVVCVMLHCDAEVWQVTGTGTDSTLQWSGPQKVHWDTGNLENWTKWTWYILMHLDTSWCTSPSELCYKMLQVVQGNRDERLWKNHWGSWVFESWQWRRSSKCLLAAQNSLFALSVCHRRDRCEPLPEATPQKERRCFGLLHCGSEDGWCRSNQPLLPCVLASLVLRCLNPYFHIFHDSFIFKFDCWLVFSSEQRFVSWRFRQCKEVNSKNGIANCGRLKVTWLWRSAFVNILFTPTKAWLEVDVFQFFS